MPTKTQAPATEKTQTRNQLSDVIDVSISTARIRSNISDLGVNAPVKAAIDEVKAAKTHTKYSDDVLRLLAQSKQTMKSATDADAAIVDTMLSGDAKAIKALSKELVPEVVTNYLSSMVLRTGDDAITAAAATANFVITKLIEYGRDGLIAESKKTLKTRHIVRSGLEELNVWPMIRNFTTVSDAEVANQGRLEEIARKKAVVREANRLKKEATKKKKSSKKKATSEPEPPAPPSESKSNAVKPERTHANDFEHHVYRIARDIVAGGDVKGDVSSEVRTFGSRIVYELCNRYATLIRYLTVFADVKTVKASTIMTINSIIMSDAGIDQTELNEYVSTRVAKYMEHSKATKATKVVAK